jgi:hypothetical protein
MPRWANRGWPMHYPILNSLGMVGYLPSQRHTKLLSLWDPIKSHMRQCITQTCSSGPDDRSLTDTGGGYHLGALNFRSDHSSSFPFSILHFPQIAPPGLQLCHSINYSSSQHSNLEPVYKSTKSHEWSLSLDFYRSSIHQA